MRKMVDNEGLFPFTPEEATPLRIYAGIDKHNDICVAQLDEEKIIRWEMSICTGHTIDMHNLTGNNSYCYIDASDSLASTLVAFSEEHNSSIYEFESFREFCKWVVGQPYK